MKAETKRGCSSSAKRSWSVAQDGTWPASKPQASHSSEEDWFCAQNGSQSGEPVIT